MAFNFSQGFGTSYFIFQAHLPLAAIYAIIGGMRRRSFTVILNFNVRHKAARDMITGVMRYATAHPEWVLLMRGNHPSNDGFSVDTQQPVDGLISGYDLSRRDEPGQDDIHALLAPGSPLRGITLVTVPHISVGRIPVSRIDIDHRQIAQSATRLLLDHDLRNFGFIGGKLDDKWSVSRCTYFRAALRERGMKASVFKPAPAGSCTWTNESMRIREWLRSLPKPCGIFAAFDQRAKHVIDCCRIEKIDVPKEIQVIGVDNEESICELTSPSLSSVAPDFEEAGYLAAKELDRLMHGGKGRHDPILVKGCTVVERLSTSDLTRKGTRVNLANDYIRLHASQRIGVADVAHAVGGSVRLIEKDFKTVLGKRIVEVIQETRLQNVAKQLKNTTRPLSAISQSSGFGCESHLKTLFKKRFGTTMSGYRAHNSQR